MISVSIFTRAPVFLPQGCLHDRMGDNMHLKHSTSATIYREAYPINRDRPLLDEITS